MSRPKPRTGFTLVEVMIAIAISGVVMGTAYRFLSFGARSAGRSGARAGAVDTTNSALMQLIRRIRYAEQILSPGDGQTSGTLEYQNLTTGGWTVSCKDGDLVLEEKIGVDKKVLAPGIEKIEFKRNGFLIKVSLFFGSGKEAREFSTILYTRGARRPPGT